MEELLIVFSQSDYTIISGGTEKSIKEQEEILGKNCMQIFPIKNFNKIYVGVNFNRKFKGIYKLKDIPMLIKSLENKYKIIGLNLHHIKGYNLELLVDTLIHIGLPITIFMHDYFYICQSFKLINSEKKFCEDAFLNSEKCGKCSYNIERKKHIKEINNFFDKVKHILDKIVVPSNYSKKVIEKYFINFKNKIFVREHLVAKEKKENNELKLNDKIRIAYLGAQTQAKGFDVFFELAQKFSEYPEYEWYYFGNSKEKLKDIEVVDVQIAKQGNNAMVEALKKYNIDIAIIWPAWPETYSYVLYEAIENKIFIITNEISGNIKDTVQYMNIGNVLKNKAELEKLLKNKELLNNKLMEHKKRFLNTKFDISINKSQELLKFRNKYEINNRERSKDSKNVILTMFYHIKKYLF